MKKTITLKKNDHSKNDHLKNDHSKNSHSKNRLIMENVPDQAGNFTEEKHVNEIFRHFSFLEFDQIQSCRI